MGLLVVVHEYKVSLFYPFHSLLMIVSITNE